MKRKLQYSFMYKAIYWRQFNRKNGHVYVHINVSSNAVMMPNDTICLRLSCVYNCVSRGLCILYCPVNFRNTNCTSTKIWECMKRGMKRSTKPKTNKKMQNRNIIDH